MMDILLACVAGLFVAIAAICFIVVGIDIRKFLKQKRKR